MMRASVVLAALLAACGGASEGLPGHWTSADDRCRFGEVERQGECWPEQFGVRLHNYPRDAGSYGGDAGR